MRNQALAQDEVAALVGAAAYFGRQWKMELRDCWMNGGYYPTSLDAGALQRLRNSQGFGPHGLVNYRLPKVAA